MRDPFRGARIARMTRPATPIVTFALVATLVIGCATAPVPEPVAPPAPEAEAVPKVVSYFSDEGFAPPSVRVSADDVLAMSDEMRRYLESDIVDRVKTKGRQVALVEAL